MNAFFKNLRFAPITATTTFAVIGFLVAGESLGKSTDRPNVVFVLADDLGWAELGCYGNTFNETPHLDALAARGMRFTNAYAAAPVCSPFRASLMTGQHPARIGITDYLRPDDSKQLPTSATTIAELFKSAGYATGMIGKWHLTGYAHHGAKEVRPTEHGFDEAIVSERRGIADGSYFHPYHFDPAIEKRLPGRENLIDRVNLEAVEFIDRHQDEPFFLYVSHYAVHTRLVGKPERVANFAHKPNAGKGNRAKRNNVHLAAQLQGIDEGVGAIVAKLDALKLTEQTIVIFMSDNGGEAKVTSNAPLRAGKSTLYEGGIREPMIVSWPGVVAGGSTCDKIVSNMDFFPTFAAIHGQSVGDPDVLDGVSILNLWKNPNASFDRDTLYWHYPLTKPHFLGGFSSGAIRDGSWKLVEHFTTGKIELFNLQDDVGEQHDLSASQPEKAKALAAKLKSWRGRIGAKVVKHASGQS